MKLDNIIVVHNDLNNEPIIINIDSISAVCIDGGTTNIYFDNWNFYVKEDIATVLRKIRSASR